MDCPAIDDTCGVYALDFSPAGELYASSEYTLWKLALTDEGVSCDEIGEFRLANGQRVLMTGLAFHPDGTPYGTSFEKAIRVRDILVDSAEKIIAQNGNDRLAEGIFALVDENTVEITVYMTDPDIRPVTTTDFTQY